MSYLPLLHYFKVQYPITVTDTIIDDINRLTSNKITVRSDYIGYSVVNSNQNNPVLKMLTLENCNLLIIIITT